MSQNTYYTLAIAALILSFSAFPEKSFANDEQHILMDTNVLEVLVDDNNNVLEDALFDESTLVEDYSLNMMRGTALSPEVLGIIDLVAVSSGNTATGTVSFGNSINEGAFSNSYGLSTVIQNSGNNVQILSGTILNVTLQ